MTGRHRAPDAAPNVAYNFETTYTEMLRTTDYVAKYLECSVTTVKQWVRAGVLTPLGHDHLPGRRRGRKAMLFVLSDIEHQLKVATGQGRLVLDKRGKMRLKSP